jgi:hypothetical protein
MTDNMNLKKKLQMNKTFLSSSDIEDEKFNNENMQNSLTYLNLQNNIYSQIVNDELKANSNRA